MEGALLRPGQILTRGLIRALTDLGYAVVSEVTLATGRRVDAMAVDGKGEISVVEVKSSVIDFRTDGKWWEYGDYCDRFYFAVPPDFPQSLLPEECGLFVVDPYGGTLIREAPTSRLPAARRKAMLVKFAQVASRRLNVADGILDIPEIGR
jgi:hypothetical protein